MKEPRLHAIDRHVTSRMRLRRRELGLSQEAVAAAPDVTFQEFQKYERTINRISAGALYRIALTLEVPVGYFFEGLKDEGDKLEVAVVNGRWVLTTCLLGRGRRRRPSSTIFRPSSDGVTPCDGATVAAQSRC